MYKKWLTVSAVTLFIIFTALNVLIADSNQAEDLEVESELLNQSFRYTSNRYTQPEVEVDRIQQDSTFENFEKVASNEYLELYVEESSLALKILDKRTGYVWDSSVDERQDYKLNKRWTNMANSAITIDYLTKKGDAKSESILEHESEVQLTETNNGFEAVITFGDSEIEMTLTVALEDDQIIVNIPNERIEEADNQLVSLRLYPFLGAVHKNDIPGYIFIPDGSGALMRFEEQNRGAKDPFQTFFYGSDLGFDRPRTTESRLNEPETLSIPVFGIAHGPNQNALLTIIEEGQYFAELMAYPSGVSTDFNWITTTYHYRYSYFQPTSQSMDGFNTFQSERNDFDITEKISFLTEDDADYVGMAKTYQQYLIDNGQLNKQTDKVDIRLEFLGAEVKKGLLWDSVHSMTTVEEMTNIVKQLNASGLKDMHVIYRGWTKGGLTGGLPNKFPIEKRLGSDIEFQEAHEYFQNADIPLYYFTDYLKAYDGARGFSGRSDVARKINAQTIGRTKNDVSYYFLRPEKLLDIAKKDMDHYKKEGISNVAIDSIGFELYSDFSKKMQMRSTVKENLEELLNYLHESLESVSLYQPNDYMWHLTDRYFDIPLHSSSYGFISDSVPFLQIVLKGYIPFYAEFSNFHSNVEDDLLRMIEYGAYPSFYLTEQESHLLMNTPSKNLYTSQFLDWESTIIEQYHVMKDSLGLVEGATIENRIVHDVGVVEVVYSNGLSIVINYTNKVVQMDGFSVNAKDFVVIDWGTQS